MAQKKLKTPYLKTSRFRRTPREWAARISVALVLLLLAFQATTNSVANVIAKVEPGRAAMIAPDNGAILAEAAEDEFRRAPRVKRDSNPAGLARRALLSDPTGVEALVVLAFQSRLRGDSQDSDQLFSLATKLSRRELKATIWMIEKAVSDGDIRSALSNYDIALRTSNQAKDILFPTLSKALAEPKIRQELLSILSSDPVWERDFMSFAINSGIEPEGAMLLIVEGRGRGLDVDEGLRTNLVNNLEATGKVETAWTLYRTFRRGADRNRSRDSNFGFKSDDRAAFDWRTGDDPNLSVAFLGNGTTGVVEFSAPPSKGGVLVKQTQLLKEGVYRLEGESAGLDQPLRSRPYWVLRCSDGREVGRLDMPNSNKNGGHFLGRLRVPENCPAQTLALVARSSDKASGVSGQITRAQLLPEI